MDSITDIFDRETSGDLDVDLVNAGAIVQKIAEERGIDLESLPDEQIAEYVAQILGPEKVAALRHAEPVHTPTQKEAAMSDQAQTPQIPDTITNADVAMELAKIAAANNIDLSTVSREEYHAAYEKVAERMTDPQAQEQVSKIAEAQEYGRQMAVGFLEVLEESEKQAQAAQAAQTPEPKTAMDYGKLRGAATKAVEHADKIVQKGGEKLLNVVGRAEGASPSLKRRAAAAGAGAGAGLAAAGGGAAAMSKKSLDEQAYELAAGFLREHGIDPETGKQAEAQPPAEEDLTEEKVAARAVEMLQEAGYASLLQEPEGK